MNITLTVAPDAAQVLEILSVAGLKQNLRISHTAEDTFAEECIREAYDYLDGLEGWLNRSILTQTWTLKLPGFRRRRFTQDRNGRPQYEWIAARAIELPLPPLQSVTSIRYKVDGTYTAVDTSLYTVITGELFGRIVLKDGLAWPTDIDTDEEAVEIVFVAGYGTGAEVLERARGIAKGMKLLASDFFRNREDTYAEPRLVAVNRKIVNGLEKIAGRYRIPNNQV